MILNHEIFTSVKHQRSICKKMRIIWEIKYIWHKIYCLLNRILILCMKIKSIVREAQKDLSTIFPENPWVVTILENLCRNLEKILHVPSLQKSLNILQDLGKFFTILARTWRILAEPYNDPSGPRKAPTRTMKNPAKPLSRSLRSLQRTFKILQYKDHEESC